MIPNVFHILKRNQENHDTFTLELSEEEARTAAETKSGAKNNLKSGAFAFLPGQFNMIYVPGFGEVAISISGAGRKGMVHTIRAVGPATRALQALKPKSAVGIRGPFGNSWPVEKSESAHVVFVAGGIGLAPLRPAIEHLAARARARAELGLTTRVYYGARTPEDRIYPKDLKRWGALPGFEVASTVDQATRAWRGHVGVVTTLMQSPVPAPSLAMTCGPEVMMRFAATKLESLGIKTSDIYLSAERNMKCAVGFCGHCQFGPHFICKDGPVFTFDRIGPMLTVREL